MTREINELVSEFNLNGRFKEIPTKKELEDLSKIFVIENVRRLTDEYKRKILNVMFAILSCDYNEIKDTRDFYVEENKVMVKIKEHGILSDTEFEMVKNNILKYFKEYNIYTENSTMFYSSPGFCFAIPIKEIKKIR